MKDDESEALRKLCAVILLVRALKLYVAIIAPRAEPDAPCKLDLPQSSDGFEAFGSSRGAMTTTYLRLRRSMIRDDSFRIASNKCRLELHSYCTMPFSLCTALRVCSRFDSPASPHC